MDGLISEKVRLRGYDQMRRSEAIEQHCNAGQARKKTTSQSGISPRVELDVLQFRWGWYTGSVGVGADCQGGSKVAGADQD